MPPVSPAERLSHVLARNRAGERAGVWAIRDAAPEAIRAALELARDRGQLAVIEKTVGDAEIAPQDVADRVRAMAVENGLPADRLLLGARLGPGPWCHLPAREAMAQAEAIAARHARAGFAKLHLDCALPCADETDPLQEAIVAKRAAALALAVEEALEEDAPRPVYVIGAEGPTPDDVRRAWHAHERAFAEKQLHDALPRIVAIALRSGVEDDDPFAAEAGAALAQAIAMLDGGVLEAVAGGDPVALIGNHVAVLQVGSAATTALRVGSPDAIADIRAALDPYADACGEHVSPWPR